MNSINLKNDPLQYTTAYQNYHCDACVVSGVVSFNIYIHNFNGFFFYDNISACRNIGMVH